MSVKNELDKFGKFLVKQSRSNLTRKGKKASGNLYKSLDYETKVSKNSFEFSFLMEDYGDFQDKGVKGTVSSAKAPMSKYSFKKGGIKNGGLTKGIDKWIRLKRIQFRKPNGRFMSYETTSFLIRRSIFRTGLPTTKFYSRPFELGFKKLPEDVVKAYALELDNLLDFSRK